MKLKIICCIKQVPFIDQLQFDPKTRRVVREGQGGEINSFDRRAITGAVRLREQYGGEVVVVTMGPPQAKEALVEALAMGCDRAVHLLGAEFIGADTLATARALAAACRKLGFDLLLCGKYSTDAETAQVPPMLAELLGLTQVTAVTQLDFPEAGQNFVAVREADEGLETVQAYLPALLSVTERLIKPIKVAPEDLEPARSKPMEVWTAASLGLDPSELGLRGSPTWVSEIYSLKPDRKQVVRLAAAGLEQATEAVARDLLAEGLFGVWKTTPRRPSIASWAGGAPDKAIWVVAEQVGGRIRPVTFEMLGRAAELARLNGGELAAVLLGHALASLTQTLAAYGAGRVYLADAPELAAYAVEPYTAVLADAIRQHNPYAVLFPATDFGRDLAPRLAARLSLGLTGDCVGLEIDGQGRLVQLKPAYGGNILAPILTHTRPALATIRPGIFGSAQPDYDRSAVIEPLPVNSLPTPRVKRLGLELAPADGLRLENAEVVIGVGMGLGNAANLALVRPLADLLDAPICATRRVVDAGWLPRQEQVGLTGKTISPRLYIALGISGKFNHMVGVQRSGVVLAVNKDPNADIFKQCDYGLVGDVFEVLPALVEAMKKDNIKFPFPRSGGRG